MKLHLIALDPVYIRQSVLPEVDFLREKELQVTCSGPFQARQQEHLGRISVSFLPLEAADGPRFFSDVAAAWALYGFLKKERPDVLVAFDAHAAAIGFWVASFLGTAVRIFRADQLPALPLEPAWRGLWGGFLLGALRKHTGTVWTSESLAARKLSQAPFGPLPLKKDTFLPSYGLPVPHLLEEANKENHLVAMTMRLQVSEKDYVLLHWGPLGRQSGIEALLEAFITLPQRCKLVCVGSWSSGAQALAPSLRRRLEDHARIVVIEEVKHPAALMTLANVLVMPRASGFSPALMEAAALMLPIITVEGNTLGGLLRNLKTALLYPEKQPAVLKEALEFALLKPDRMLALAEVLQGEVLQQWHRPVLHQRTLHLYRELLSAPPGEGKEKQG
ncbi:MAG: glycosyltransferase [Nitritalea sp.]